MRWPPSRLESRSTICSGEVLEKYPDHRAAVERLKDALANFDEAPIYTIHGFCQRVLAEQAFETGTLFDAELVTDERDLLREVTWDFWRRNFYSNDSLGVFLAIQGKITPKKLLKDLEELAKNPTLTILPKDLRSSAEAAGNVERGAGRGAQGSGRKCADGIRAFFAKPVWAKGDHKKADLLARCWRIWNRSWPSEGASARQFNSIELLATEVIANKGLRKGSILPENPIFGVCQNFVDCSAEFCAAIARRVSCLGAGTNSAVANRRGTFSPLKICSPASTRRCATHGGVGLGQSRFAQQYRVALVDEFQDTDPVQYSIFERIYQASDATVAFIGDPKQAIYSFRGADVFTYLNAARDTKRQFTLRTNWRSESGLVRAVNAVFDRPDSFQLDEIQFRPANRDRAPTKRRSSSSGKAETPFHIWTSSGKEKLSDCVATEIVGLLGRGATIDGKKLEPGHIAVLTSTNAQAAEMQVALRARRVPSVLYSSANVFTSHEAHEMRDLLAAAAQPGNEKFVRAALCTDALGFTGNEIDALSRRRRRLGNGALRFQEHHRSGASDGFVRMLRQLAVAHGVRQRLLGYRDGERRLTNFLHLSELLHAACVEHRLGMTGILKWLGQEMQAGNMAPREECELRLESDEEAVRIITVHKSKGLEFDVVFCPYVWSDAISAGRPFTIRRENYRLTLDLVGSDGTQADPGKGSAR